MQIGNLSVGPNILGTYHDADIVIGQGLDYLPGLNNSSIAWLRKSEKNLIYWIILLAKALNILA